MTKHLIGFGLFSSIVGFFVLAYWSVAYLPPVPEITVVSSPPAKLREYCNLKRRAPTVGDERAFADRNTGKITVYVNEFPGGSHVDPSEFSADFTFYTVRGDEVRLVDVIKDSLLTSVRRDSETKWILQYERNWVRRLSANENLYVMPGASYDRKRPAVAAEFSKATAIPVLIRN